MHVSSSGSYGGLRKAGANVYLEIFECESLLCDVFSYLVMLTTVAVSTPNTCSQRGAPDIEAELVHGLKLYLPNLRMHSE